MDVHLLWFSSHWAADAEVPMVEEIHHSDATGRLKVILRLRSMSYKVQGQSSMSERARER